MEHYIPSSKFPFRVKAEGGNSEKTEFWAFLQSQGFPAGINEESIQRTAENVEFQAHLDKRLKLRRWRWVEGGLHSDDVALVWLLAESLGLKQGVEWDLGLESDNYHFSVAYIGSPQVDELSRLVELYHDATMVLMQVEISSEENMSDEELQQVFREEWNRLREEKQRMHDETAKLLKEAFKQIGF